MQAVFVQHQPPGQGRADLAGGGMAPQFLFQGCQIQNLFQGLQVGLGHEVACGERPWAGGSR